MNDYWTRIARERIGRRRALQATGSGLVGAALLAACGGSSSNGGLKLDDSGTARQPGTVWQAKNDWHLADETKQAVRGGIYRNYRVADLPSHFDPTPQVGSQAPTAAYTYEMLLARHRGPGIEPGTEAFNNPTPALAESWEVSADATTVTFKLRPNVKFHNIAPVNGRVMDIDDWRTSFQRYSASSPYRLALDETLDKMEFPDAKTMVWKFKAPYAPIFDRIYAYDFAPYIMPKELNADPKLAEQKQIGTGHRIVDKHQPSVTVEYRKHPEFWGGDPFIDRWHEPIVPEYANAYAQFVQGNVTSFTPTAKDVMLLRKDAPNTVIIAQELPQETASVHKWGKINQMQRAWKDERIRIAFRKAIDYTSIAKFLSNKTEFESNGIPVEISMMTHIIQNPAYWLNPEKGELGEYSKNYLYDVAEAKKLTAAAGFNDVVDIPYYVSGTGALTDAEALVHDSLKQSNVFKVDLKQVSANEYRITINVDGLFEGIQSQNSGAQNDLDYVMYRNYHSSRVGGVPFPDAKADQLGEAQRREADPQKRAAIAKEIQLYLAQKFFSNPGRSLYTTFTARWPWLHNSTYANNTGAIDSIGAFPELGGHLHWLDADMPRRNTPA